MAREEWAWAANLPTSFWETGDLHPELGTAWTRSRWAIWWTWEILLASGSTRKLHSQSFTFEIAAICRGIGISGKGFWLAPSGVVVTYEKLDV